MLCYVVGLVIVLLLLLGGCLVVVVVVVVVEVAPACYLLLGCLGLLESKPFLFDPQQAKGNVLSALTHHT